MSLLRLCEGATPFQRQPIGKKLMRPLPEPPTLDTMSTIAIVNEAALSLAVGVACRPADVDVVLVQGYGFPRWEGGPVFWTRQQDRAQLETDLQGLAMEAGYGFVVADLDPLFAN